MSKVEELRPNTEIGYQISNDDGVFTVASKCNRLEIGFENDKPVVKFGNVTVEYSRAHLARMLWAAAYLVDSQGVWREDRYPARDYEDGPCIVCGQQLLPFEEYSNGCHEWCRLMAVSKRKCKHKPCGKYSPVETLHRHANRWFCNEVCAGLWQLDQNRDDREKADRRRHKEKLKQVRRNPRAEALIVAQELARISRADDDGFCTCVTCGHVGRWNDGFDGGHYIAKGSSSFWMLDPRNIWPQCKPCNGNGMKFDGRESLYTLFMIKEFGPEFVQHMQDVKKTTIKRSVQDFDDYISKTKAEIKTHKQRIGA